LIAVDCNTIVVNSKVIRDFFFINEELNLILKGIVNIEAMNLYGSNNIFQIAYQIIANVSYFCIINTMTMNRSLYILFAFFTTFFTPKTVESQIRPTEISGLQLWLRADSNVTLNGTTVNSWNDCSGNGNNVIQTGASPQPNLIYNAIKGLPVVRFDGVDDFLDGGKLMCQVGLSGSTIFLICKKTSGDGIFIGKFIAAGSSTRWWLNYYNGQLLSNYNGNTNCGVNRSSGTFEQLSVVWDRTNYLNKLYANGSIIGNWVLNTGNPNNNYNFLIGAGANVTGTIPPLSGTYLNGDIAEVVIYNRALNENERKKVELYLRNKYTTTVNLGPDITKTSSLCDTILHAGMGFALYKWNTGETTESIKASKGTFYVSVVDNNGFPSIDTIQISYLGTKLNQNKSILCKDEIYSLKTTVQPSAYIYKWNTGIIGNNIAVSTKGNYYATVTDKNSCSVITDTASFTIDSFKSEASLGNDTSLCQNNTIGLIKPKIMNDGTHYIWSTADTTATIKVLNSGTYSLTATNNNACSASDAIYVSVTGTAPIPNFSYSLQNNQTISFNNTSNVSGDNWKWDFDDGSFSINENPTHSFNVGSNYTITFQIGSGSCINSISKQLYIQPFNKSDLMLWLRADSNLISVGKNVDIWNDCSGNKNNIIQTSTSSQPLYTSNILNGLPIVRFDGSNDYLFGGDICNISPLGISIFIVGKCNTSTGTYIAKSIAGGFLARYGISHYLDNLEYVYDDNGSAPEVISKLTQFKGYDLISAISNKQLGINKLWLQNKLQGSYPIKTISNMKSNYPFLVGAYNNTSGGIPPLDGTYLNGDIAEIIIFNKPLKDVDRISVETYLKNKYGMKPVSLGDDITITKSLCDTTIHAGKGYSAYLWSTGDTTESITIKKSGLYTVNVKDAVFGYESTDNIKVTFNAEPHQIPDTTICPKASLSWDTKLNTTDFDFKWSTGETSSSIIIKNAGNYILTVNDKFGCSYISDTVKVKIDDFDKSIDLGNDTTLCKNNELELVKGADRAVQYSWSDDTHNKTMILVSGEKYYYVTATDKYTCTAKDSIKVKVQGIAPITPFTMTGHCQNNEITLKDNSVLSDNTTKIIAYKWIIESDTLLSKDTSYLFKNAGLYYIKHIAITNGACSGSKTLPITINPLPTISFTPKSVCQYSLVNFINTSSFNTSNSESIIWSIKGIKVEGKDTTTYKFNSYGLTNVSLTITTNDNCTDSLVKQVEVKSTPKAIFSNSPACGLNDYFLFDKSTSPTAEGLTTRNWYVNYLTSQEQTIHLKPDSTLDGDNVLLKVTGVNGCFDTVSRFIPYSPIPKAALEFKKSCVGDLMTFSDKSTVAKGSIVKWKWNIGNNIESYEQNPSVIFTESKTYPITLHVTSDKGCEDTIVSQTKVIKKPIAAFDYNPKIAGAPIDINFTNTSDSATSYKWTFGDSESSPLFEPIHEYSDSGKYTVSLYSYNDYMCADSSKKIISLQKANYKIDLYSITSTDKNGYVTVNTVFINAGLNPFTNIDFILTKDDGTNIKETWKGLNTTGVIDTFLFASKFKASNGTELPKYICIDANVIDKHDSIVATNRKCITSLKEFTFLSAFPIPADDNLTLTFVSPEKGNAQYAIYSGIGQIIKENSVAIVEGINRITFPTNELNQGYYIWKLNVAGKEKTGKLLICRSLK